MKSVLEPIEGMRRVLPKECFNDRAEYVSTKYSIEVNCDSGRLLYNTLSGELILIEKDDKLELLRDKLIESRFLVPSTLDEFAFVKQVKHLISLIQPPSSAVTTYTVLTTTDCNARCFYCYERGIVRKSMSIQTAHDVAEYISMACRGEKVAIHWFGGEPLYNIDAIDTIAEDLNSHDVRFESHITSNGYFLDDRTAIKASHDWHTRYVQVAIDGTEDIYNRTKSYLNAEGSSYERILHNIGSALNAGIEVIIRLNMDAGNINDLYLVCDELARRFKDKRGLHAVVIPIAPLKGKVHEFDNADDMVRSYIDLTEYVEEQNLLQPYGLPRKLHVNRCIADNCSAEVILPDGQISKCEHFDEKEYIGDIYSSQRDEVVIESWAKRANAYPQCHNCALYPRCTPLERCAWDARICDKSKQAIRLYKYRKRILAEYERYKRSL